MKCDFSQVITWSDIISIVAVVVTLGTAIVAICISRRGNKISQKQLIDALRIHEQSKSIGLYDKRCDVLEKINNDCFDCERDIRFLFSEECLIHFFVAQKIYEDFHNAHLNRNSFYIYFDPENKVFGGKTFDDSDIDMFFCREVLKREKGIETDEQYIKFCYDNSAYVQTGEDEYEYSSYYDVTKNYDETNNIYQNAKSILIGALEKFVNKTIEPISKNEVKHEV